MVLRNIGILILGLGAVAGSARATTTYSTAAAFQSAVVNLSTVDFETATASSNGLLDLATGVQFSDQNGTDTDLTVLATCANPCGSTGELEMTSGFVLNISLPSTTRSFGLDLVTFNPGGTVNIVFTSGGQNNPFSVVTNGTDTFMGFTAAGQITSLELTGQSPIGIDNFQVDGIGGGAVPETRTMLLIGSGLILIHQLRRRQKRREIVLPQAVDRFA